MNMERKEKMLTPEAKKNLVLNLKAILAGATKTEISPEYAEGILDILKESTINNELINQLAERVAGDKCFYYRKDKTKEDVIKDYRIKAIQKLREEKKRNEKAIN